MQLHRTAFAGETIIKKSDSYDAMQIDKLKIDISAGQA